MGELAGLAKTLHDYGIYAVAAALLVVVVWLFRELRKETDARFSDKDKHHAELTALLTKSIETDKDQAHAMAALTDVIRSRPHV